MALFKLDVVERDNKDFSATYLLNTEKVGNFYYDSSARSGSGGTIFHYVENEDRKNKAVRYITSESYTTFEDHFNEAMQKRRINLQIVAKGETDETWEQDVNVDANRIVYAENDSTGSFAYVYFENGAFETLRYKTKENIDEIESESSTSASA